MVRAATPPRNLDLEASIVADPDDLGARMVYGDWLQAQGDPRGEWAAIMARVEADPENIRLRSAAIEVLAEHRNEIVGPQAALLAKGYVGWRGGFADEVRIQPTALSRRNLFGFFAHPTYRFVRHIAVGEQHADAIAAIAAAELPLLDEVVACDRLSEAAWILVPALAKLTISKLTLCGMVPTAPMPALRSVTLVADDSADLAERWFVNRGAPNVTRLVVLPGTGDQLMAGILDRMVSALPKLEELLVIGDVEVGEHPRLTRIPSPALYAPTKLSSINWFLSEFRARGRDAIRHAPGAGHILYNVATARLMESHKHARECIPYLDASATLPAAAVAPYQFANAAIAHEQVGELDQAELRAREALLYTPREPNYHAILLDALRRTDRLREAVRALPAAVRALAKPLVYNQRGGTGACLLDCMLVLVQAGKLDDAVGLATKYKHEHDDRHRALMAMIELARGKKGEAKRWFRQAQKADLPIVDHARATLLAADGQLAEARAALARAKKANYSEAHWVAVDPLLAATRGKPARNRGARKPR